MLPYFYQFVASALGALFALVLVRNVGVVQRFYARVQKLFVKPVSEEKPKDPNVPVRVRLGGGEVSYWEGKPGISKSEAFLVYFNKQNDTYSPLTSEGLVDPKEVWPGDVFRQTYREANVARVTKTLPPQKPWARVEDYVLSPEEREEREAEMAEIAKQREAAATAE